MLNEEFKDTFDEIFCIAICFVHAYWQKIKYNPNITLFNFKEVISQTITTLNKALQRKPKSIIELRRRLL